MFRSFCPINSTNFHNRPSLELRSTQSPELRGHPRRMAKPTKRRDRRVAPSSATAQNRKQPNSSTEQDVLSESTSDRKLILIFVVFFVLSPAIAVLVYLKYAPDTETPISSARGGGFVKTDVTYQEVLAENSRVSENASRRNFGNPVLAYITPWNSKGYEIAKRFNSKFTHLSPVWYELKSQGSSLTLDGRHNADAEWISELRTKGDALVLPRVVLEALPTEMLRKKKQRVKAIQLIITECKEMGYDGIVLESWSRWAAYGILDDPDLRTMALQFIQELGRALHSASLERNGGQKLQLVYVIGPPRSKELEMHDFGPADLRSLDGAVDGFSLMTYDFSGPNNPGPNAPLKWIHSIMRLLLGSGGDKGLARKVFVGLNFYGNDFDLSGGGGAITGADYLSLLEKHKPLLRWENNSEEHLFVYTDQNNAKHVVFYPSLMSIFLRLEEARRWDGGISIWEVGQGLDYFYDLL